MDERIKELFKQTALHRNDHTTEQRLYEVEKFARLIIQECLSMAQSHSSQNCDYAAGIDSVRENIKEHFGVE